MIIHKSCRNNDRVGEYKEINPLLVQTKCMGEDKMYKKTAMHLAIEMRRAERALVLLRETGGRLSLVSYHFLFVYHHKR